MKEVYQVIFTKLKKGNYLIEVPDLDARLKKDECAKKK